MASTFMIFIILFFSLALIREQANGDANLIQKTCKSTKYFDLCISSLRSNSSSANTDTKGLATIMTGIGAANATATSTYLSSQLLNASNGTNLKKVLKDCSDKYTYAADALEASTEDLADESYDYAYMHVMAAADYPHACYNAFRRFPELVYPREIALREDGLKRICDVVLGIIDRILLVS